MHGPPKDPYRTARKFHKAAQTQAAEHRRFWDDMATHAPTASKLPRKVVRNCTTTATGGGLPKTSFTTVSVSTSKKNG